MPDKVNYIKPFLKWPGGKFRVLPHIHAALPQGKRLVEPFVGSGAVFLNSHYKRYFLNDINPDLINLYQIIQDQPEQFIQQAKRYFSKRYNTTDQYYYLRDEFNRTHDKLKKSLLFLYLNRHGYNGLCRYNQKGKFNVPFGRYKNSYFPSLELEHFAERAQRAQFSCLSFEKFLLKSQQGDVIYCDPPYVPLSSTASFTQYSQYHFNLTAQEKLAMLAQQLRIKKIPVIISNHDTPLTRKLYKQADLSYFLVRRSISCQGQRRSMVKELLAVFPPLAKGDLTY